MHIMSRVAALGALGLVLGPGAALAQSAVTEEAVRPNGGVAQTLAPAFTAAQKSAIYNAVVRERVRPLPVPLTAAVGAAVPPGVQLSDLPDQATAADPRAELLKYALVESDVVVVDPVEMRVVDVIHGGGP